MLMSVIDASESVEHGQCSQLALGLCAVLSRRKLGGCALLILRQPTSDAGRRTAIIIVNHLAQSPPPTTHTAHCPLPTAAATVSTSACCTEARGWSAEGNRHAGSETALQLGLDVLPACPFVKSRQSAPRVWGQRRTGAAGLQSATPSPCPLIIRHLSSCDAG